MAVDEAADAAPRPEAIAAEIHRQLGDIPAPIPVHEIAMALRIEQITERPLTNFEGMLVTDQERSSGSILVNSRSGSDRRRYSIGHELAHYLCYWHKQTGAGFQCTRRDMASPVGEDLHIRQEKEANRFAIELLAPKRLFTPYLRGLPDLERVVAAHRNLEVSKIAAARRYAELHRERLAVVFAKGGLFQYASRGGDFPYLRMETGNYLPVLPTMPGHSATSEMTEADPEQWPGLEKERELGIQVLIQDDGHAILLLHLADTDDEADQTTFR